MYLSGIALPSTYYVHPPHLAIINLSSDSINDAHELIGNIRRTREREIMTRTVDDCFTMSATYPRGHGTAYHTWIATSASSNNNN